MIQFILVVEKKYSDPIVEIFSSYEEARNRFLSAEEQACGLSIWGNVFKVHTEINPFVIMERFELK